MHILQETIIKAKKEKGLALIPFLTAGFPNDETFENTLTELDNGPADVIEIGVPFSDPVADGPVVEAASHRALAQGVTLENTLSRLAERKLQTPLVFMGYYNPFLQYGLAKFAEKAAGVGVRGCIVPDLPLAESKEFRQILKEHGIALISLVGPNTSSERMKEYAAVSEGFVYVVSTLGTTGVRQDLPSEAVETLKRARTHFELPVALGFGLHHPSQLASLPAEAEPGAAVFGSAFLNHLDAKGSVADFFAPWLRKH